MERKKKLKKIEEDLQDYVDTHGDLKAVSWILDEVLRYLSPLGLPENRPILLTLQDIEEDKIYMFYRVFYIEYNATTQDVLEKQEFSSILKILRMLNFFKREEKHFER